MEIISIKFLVINRIASDRSEYVKKCLSSRAIFNNSARDERLRKGTSRVSGVAFFTSRPTTSTSASCYVYVYQLHHYSAVDPWQDRWYLDISAASRLFSRCVRTRNMVAKWSISVRTMMRGHTLCFPQRPFLFSFFLLSPPIITSMFSAERCWRGSV